VTPRRRSFASAEVGLIFVVALCIRLLYAVPQAELPAINNMGVYDQLAMGLVEGTGYVSELEPHFHSLRAPGYPIFLAAVYSTFGHHIGAVMVLHALLSALTCVLIYRIGLEVFGRRVGLLASVLCVVDPAMIHWSAILVTETLFIFNLEPELFGRQPTQVMPPGFNEIEQSRRGREIYLDYAQADPKGFAGLAFAKASLLFNPLPRVYPAHGLVDYGFGPYDVFVRYYSLLFLLLTFSVAPLGLIMRLRSKGPSMLLAGGLAYHVVFLVTFRPALRYFLPGLVLASLFSSAGLLTLRERAKREPKLDRATRWRLVGWLAVLAAVLLNSWHQVVRLRGDRLAGDWEQMRRLLGL
jgi:hypothetical protein